MMWFLANEEVSFIDSLTITGVCVLIVFLMLILLALIVAAFEWFKPKNAQPEVQEEVATPVAYTQPSTLKLEDIKDEDMMVAALVATIDYHEETKEDVRVVSIKQIG